MRTPGHLVHQAGSFLGNHHSNLWQATGTCRVHNADRVHPLLRGMWCWECQVSNSWICRCEVMSKMQLSLQHLTATSSQITSCISLQLPRQLHQHLLLHLPPVPCPKVGEPSAQLAYSHSTSPSSAREDFMHGYSVGPPQCRIYQGWVCWICRAILSKGLLRHSPFLILQQPLKKI